MIKAQELTVKLSPYIYSVVLALALIFGGIFTFLAVSIAIFLTFVISVVAAVLIGIIYVVETKKIIPKLEKASPPKNEDTQMAWFSGGLNVANFIMLYCLGWHVLSITLFALSLFIAVVSFFFKEKIKKIA